jgi:hypothetical protein
LEKLAGQRELNTARRPVEETVPNDLFQPSDLLAQWRLGDTKALCGLAEMKRLRHRNEVSKMSKFEVSSHIRAI